MSRDDPTGFTAPCDLDPGRTRRLHPLDPCLADGLGSAFAALSPWADYPYPAASLAAYLSKIEPGAPRYLITSDGATAGAVGLRLDWLRGPYLQFLGLLPAYQGRGLGAEVLSWLEREARAAGQRNVWVAASDFNAGAIRFYARHGFREVARLDDLVRDGRTEVLLRKAIV